MAGTVNPRKVAGGRRNPAVFGEESTAPRWLRQVAGTSWRLLVVVFTIALVFFGLAKVELVIIALFLGLVFTGVLRPAVDWLDRFMPRGLATAVSLLGGFAFFAGLLSYVVYSVADQWSTLSAQFSVGIDRIIKWLESDSLPFKLTSEQIATWIQQGQKWVQSNAGHLLGQAASSAGSVVEVFTALALATFCSIFFLARGRQMWAWFLNQLPVRYREDWRRAAGAGWYTFSGYTRGTVLIALSDGILAFIALEAIRVPLAAPLAVLVFIGAFIPLVGAPTAMVVAMIVALATLGPLKAAIVGVVIALIGQLEGHLLQPMIMGKQVSLHPVVIALSVAVGTLTAGIFGAVIVVPLVSVAWAIFSHMRTVDPPDENDDSDGSRASPTPDGETDDDDADDAVASTQALFGD